MAHLVKPSVNVCIVRGSKVLLSRRANTGWKDGWLCLPGGHVEPDESPTAAMIREIAEELGVQLDPADLEFLCVAARHMPAAIDYVAYEFVVRDKAYDFQNAEPQKCGELLWAEIDSLPEDVIDDFREIIQRGLGGGQTFLELNY